MTSGNLLEKMLGGELRELLVISYIVLGNNAVTNRYIERRFRMPVHAWSALLAVKTFPGIREGDQTALSAPAKHDQPGRLSTRGARLPGPGGLGFRRSRKTPFHHRGRGRTAHRAYRRFAQASGGVAVAAVSGGEEDVLRTREEDRGGPRPAQVGSHEGIAPLGNSGLPSLDLPGAGSPIKLA